MAECSGIGIWSSELRYGDPAEAADSAAELEGLGFTALWIPDVGGPVFEALDNLLAATSTVTIATGILNVWKHRPDEVGTWWNALPATTQVRLLIGLGVSHGPFIGEEYRTPLATMRTYVENLGVQGLPADRLGIAALGPKMLELARDRTAGACPYLVTPDHTAQARSALGDAGLWVEQGVVLERDADTARTVARAAIAHYFALPNYTNNWRRLGFTDEEIDGQSDRLIDALVAWGDLDSIAARIDEHLAAGADHVCIQALVPRGESPREAWRTLAPLTGAR